MRRRPSATLIAIALPVLATLAIAPFALGAAGSLQDEGAIVLYADRIIHGAVAYRDFQTYYGPGTSWVVGAGFLVGGENLAVERLISLSWHLVVALMLVAIAWRWGRRPAILTGLIASLLLGPLGAWDQPWFAALGLGLASIALMAKWSGGAASRWCVACPGVLAALALSFRPDLAPALVLAAIPFLAGRHRDLGPFVVGAAVGFVPLMVQAVVATPAAMFQNLFVDPVLRTGPARHLPVPPAGGLTAAAFVAGLVSMLVLGGAAARLVTRARNDPRTRLLASAALLSIGLMPQILQRADLDHILEGVCVAASLAPVTIPIVWGAFAPTSLRLSTTRFTALCAMLTLAGVAAVDGHLHADAGTTVTNQGRSFLLAKSADAQNLFAGHPAEVAATLAAVDRLAHPGARLFVGPSDLRRTDYNSTFLYFMFPELTPGTYYLEMEPLSANRSDSHLPAQIARDDIVVLDSQWDLWHEANRSAQFGDIAANLVVMRDFCLRQHAGVYDVFTRCAKVAGG